jgi:hypothetical protein
MVVAIMSLGRHGCGNHVVGWAAGRGAGGDGEAEWAGVAGGDVGGRAQASWWMADTPRTAVRLAVDTRRTVPWPAVDTRRTVPWPAVDTRRSRPHAGAGRSAMISAQHAITCSITL